MKKQNLTFLFAAGTMLILIFLGPETADAAVRGIEVCLKTVVPSLFPFFVLSVLLVGNAGTNVLFRPLGRLFRIPPGSEVILITGLLGGYPVGAKAAAQGYAQGNLSQEDANRMLRFCSQPGPGFIFGMAASAFPSIIWGFALWGIQLLSAWLVSRVFSSHPEHSRCISSPRGISLGEALRSAIQITAEVCGWVILFRILICLTVEKMIILPIWAKCILSGFLELTNGCLYLKQISDIGFRFMLCSILLSFGGCCVLMQTRSAAGSLNLRYYIQGKAVQVLFCGLVSLAFWHNNLPLILIIIFLGFLLPKMQKRAGNQPSYVV